MWWFIPLISGMFHSGVFEWTDTNITKYRKVVALKKSSVYHVTFPLLIDFVYV